LRALPLKATTLIFLSIICLSPLAGPFDGRDSQLSIVHLRRGFSMFRRKTTAGPSTPFVA